MGGLDPAKLLVILVLALVVLGPERLPKAAKQMGSFLRDFAAWRARLEQEVKSAIPDVEIPKIPVVRRGGITSYLTGMMASTDDHSATAAVGEDEVSVAEPSPGGLVVPNGVPASWSSEGDGSLLPGISTVTPLPSAPPEAALRAEVRIELDDPSWN